MMIVDAHLDLAYNALRGRNVLAPAVQQQADEEGIPTVGLPDLRSGKVNLICATIFVAPDEPGHPGYHTVEQAHQQAVLQLDFYERLDQSGDLANVGMSKAAPSDVALGNVALGNMAPSDVTLANAAPSKGPLNLQSPGAVLLLEGAEPIRTPADVALFHQRGVRIVGLAWHRTRYAGGTGAAGPLTPAGLELVRELDRFDILHDLSHLAEQSFWNLLEATDRPVIASHSNCRAIVGDDPNERHLSNRQIQAVIRRGGVIGINFFDRFLLPSDQYRRRRATLSDVVAHIRHICDLAGNTLHVGIGTDMDGGLGRNEIPEEIQTSADLPRLAEALRDANFTPADVDRIMHGNWLRVLPCNGDRS